jgi:hypothetical protein
MSAVLKEVSQRLRVVSVHEHRTIAYEGRIHDFIEMIMREGWSGQGRFTVAKGDNFFGLTFDMREKAIDSNDKT